jgi:hypothetical protein
VDDGTGQKSGGECGLGKKTQLIEAKEGGGGGCGRVEEHSRRSRGTS